MADLSAKPPSGHCRHGSVRGPDHWLQTAVWLRDLRIDRRDLVWINVTTNPTAGGVARQIPGAFPWDMAPRYVIRDRDRIYGIVVIRRLRAMGIRDKPTCTSLTLAEPPQGPRTDEQSYIWATGLQRTS